MDNVTPAPETPSTQTAAEAAIAAGNTSEYRAARRAERAGQPLPDVDVAAVEPDATHDAGDPAPVASQPPPKKSRAERDQDRINEAIQRGIDAATAPLKDTIARLEQSRTAPPPAETKTEPAAKTPDYKRIMTLPGAPKLADFDSIEEHNFAAAAFVEEVRASERAEAAARTGRQAELTQAQQRRVESFVQRLDETKKADPEFSAKIAPEVRALKPFGALQPGEVGGPLNVVAEQVMDSPMAPAVLVHLSQPGALEQLVAMPPSVAAIRDPRAQANAHIRHIVAEFNRLEGRLAGSAGETHATDAPFPKTITDAPDPPASVGSRPAKQQDELEAAIARGDTQAYRRIKRERARQAKVRV